MGCVVAVDYDAIVLLLRHCKWFVVSLGSTALNFCVRSRKGGFESVSGQKDIPGDDKRCSASGFLKVGDIAYLGRKRNTRGRKGGNSLFSKHLLFALIFRITYGIN